jgi:hypothetical protein
MNSINVIFASGITAGANMADAAAEQFVRGHVFALMQVVGGLVLVAVFMLMSFAVPFKMIDAVFTLGILIALAPLMIAGYVYDDTRGFSKKGIESLVHIAFYLIIYSIFLGIFYAAFSYIGDAYYPGPVDGFTYLFPDFVFGNDGVATLKSNPAFAQCFADFANNFAKTQKCMVAAGADFSFPSIADPMGTILPMALMGSIAMMIMGNLKNYAGIYGGYMINVGGAAQSLLKSGIDMVFNVGVKKAGDFIGSPVERVMNDRPSKLSEIAEDLSNGGRP